MEAVKVPIGILANVAATMRRNPSRLLEAREPSAQVRRAGVS
jgi:hypothetical protein